MKKLLLSIGGLSVATASTIAITSCGIRSNHQVLDITVDDFLYKLDLDTTSGTDEENAIMKKLNGKYLWDMSEAQKLTGTIPGGEIGTSGEDVRFETEVLNQFIRKSVLSGTEESNKVKLAKKLSSLNSETYGEVNININGKVCSLEIRKKRSKEELFIAETPGANRTWHWAYKVYGNGLSELNNFLQNKVIIFSEHLYSIKTIPAIITYYENLKEKRETSLKKLLKGKKLNFADIKSFMPIVTPSDPNFEIFNSHESFFAFKGDIETTQDKANDNDILESYNLFDK